MLASEAVVEQHGREDAEMALYLSDQPTRSPGSRGTTLRLSQSHRHRVPDQDFGWYCIELAAYGWRRDYDEWPTSPT